MIWIIVIAVIIAILFYFRKSVLFDIGLTVSITLLAIVAIVAGTIMNSKVKPIEAMTEMKALQTLQSNQESDFQKYLKKTEQFEAKTGFVKFNLDQINPQSIYFLESERSGSTVEVRQYNFPLVMNNKAKLKNDLLPANVELKNDEEIEITWDEEEVRNEVTFFSTKNASLNELFDFDTEPSYTRLIVIDVPKDVKAFYDESMSLKGVFEYE